MALQKNMAPACKRLIAPLSGVLAVLLAATLSLLFMVSAPSSPAMAADNASAIAIVQNHASADQPSQAADSADDEASESVSSAAPVKSAKNAKSVGGIFGGTVWVVLIGVLAAVGYFAFMNHRLGKQIAQMKAMLR